MNSSDKSVRWLLAVAVIISFPLFAGVRAAAVGVDIAATYPFYEHLEIASGALLAFMEGWALYFVAGKWQQFKTFSVYWWIIAGINLVISLILPFTSTAYLVSAQFSQPVFEVLKWRHLWENHLTWLWTFAVAAITTLLVIGLGIVHGLPQQVATKEEPGRDMDALRDRTWGYLSRNMGNWPQPGEVVKALGGEISEVEAVEFMGEWYNTLDKKPGVKSAKEQGFIRTLEGATQESVAVNGNGRH